MDDSCGTHVWVVVLNVYCYGLYLTLRLSLLFVFTLWVLLFRPQSILSRDFQSISSIILMLCVPSGTALMGSILEIAGVELHYPITSAWQNSSYCDGHKSQGWGWIGYQSPLLFCCKGFGGYGKSFLLWLLTLLLRQLIYAHPWCLPFISYPGRATRAPSLLMLTNLSRGTKWEKWGSHQGPNEIKLVVVDTQVWIPSTPGKQTVKDGWPKVWLPTPRRMYFIGYTQFPLACSDNEGEKCTRWVSQACI